MSKNTELNQKIGNRLRELRLEKGFSMKQVAMRLKGDRKDGTMSEQGYRRIERGEVTLKPDNAERLAKLYKVSITYIFCTDDERTEEETIKKEFAYHFDWSKNSKRFYSSLGIRRQPMISTRYVNISTGDDVSFRKDMDRAVIDEDSEIIPLLSPDGYGIRKENEYIECIQIGKHVFYIPAEKWSNILEITMKSALASIQISCETFKVTDVADNQ